MQMWVWSGRNNERKRKKVLKYRFNSLVEPSDWAGVNVSRLEDPHPPTQQQPHANAPPFRFGLDVTFKSIKTKKHKRNYLVSPGGGARTESEAGFDLLLTSTNGTLIHPDQKNVEEPMRSEALRTTAFTAPIHRFNDFTRK